MIASSVTSRPVSKAFRKIPDEPILNCREPAMRFLSEQTCDFLQEWTVCSFANEIINGKIVNERVFPENL